MLLVMLVVRLDHVHHFNVPDREQNGPYQDYSERYKLRRRNRLIEHKVALQDVDRDHDHVVLIDWIVQSH